MHIVFKSERARGGWSLRRHGRAVNDALRTMARRYGIRIYEFANVGSHLHLLARARHRRALQNFLRSFGGLVARKVTGARRGVPKGRFWSAIAWSRIVAWGRDFVGVRHYVVRNEIEAAEGRLVRFALEHGPTPATGPPFALARSR